MLFEVKEHEDTAHPPHVNAIAELQAEEHFWSPDEERRAESDRGQHVKREKNSTKCHENSRGVMWEKDTCMGLAARLYLGRPLSLERPYQSLSA